MKKFSTFNGFFSQNPTTAYPLWQNAQYHQNDIDNDEQTHLENPNNAQENCFIQENENFCKKVPNYNSNNLKTNENTICNDDNNFENNISKNSQMLFKKMQIHDQIINNSNLPFKKNKLH